LPTTEFTPNLGKDLTGFIDGTRNPDHLLRALVDEVLIFPRDEENRHVGGCFMYAGKFIHDLYKFHNMSEQEKNHTIGRTHGTESAHKGYDSRPENPRLDQAEYRSKHVRDSQAAPNRFHTNRAHGAIYRQSMPFVQGNDEGLFFVAFSRFIDEFERSLNRMCGEFQADGSTDALFEITRAISSGYYYIPSVLELQALTQATYIENLVSVQPKPSEDHIRKMRIVAEYCTNCGYKTIFLEKKKVLESVIPEIEWIINPKMPRLASFEIYLEDGTVIWSKLAQPNGMNNYPECWPTNQYLVHRMRELLNRPDLVSIYDEPGVTFWGEFN
jgi:selT/selW/selH-like putative selenoprotein